MRALRGYYNIITHNYVIECFVIMTIATAERQGERNGTTTIWWWGNNHWLFAWCCGRGFTTIAHICNCNSRLPYNMNLHMLQIMGHNNNQIRSAQEALAHDCCTEWIPGWNLPHFHKLLPISISRLCVRIRPPCQPVLCRTSFVRKHCPNHQSLRVQWLIRAKYGLIERGQFGQSTEIAHRLGFREISLREIIRAYAISRECCGEIILRRKQREEIDVPPCTTPNRTETVESWNMVNCNMANW